MGKNAKIIITMVMVLTIVLVNMSFINTAEAKEDLTIEKTLGSQMKRMAAKETVSQDKYMEGTVSRNKPQEAVTGEKQSKEKASTNQTSDEEITSKKGMNEESTGDEEQKTKMNVETTGGKEQETKMNEETTGDKEQETKMNEETTGDKEQETKMNEETTGDEREETETIEASDNPFGIQIISDNLPDYVEVVIEKTNVKPFQDALDEFYNQWCDDQEEEYNSEDEDLEDEDYDDEDYDEDKESDDEGDVVTDDDRDVVTDNDGEDGDNDDLENEEPDDHYLFYKGANRVLSAYKISFINTKDGSEYEIPENQSVKVKVDNTAYDNSAAGGIMNLENDGSVEMLQYEQIYDNATDEQEEENTADTYNDGDGNSDNNSDNFNDDNTDSDNEYGEDYNDEYDGDEADDIYQETIIFDIDQGGKYAILSALVAKTTSDSSGYGRAEPENNSKISPKTGVGNKWIAGEFGALALLVVSGYYYRKKKIAKVHEND